MLGLNKMNSMKKKPNLILSGVNEGVNLGYDLLYSGTVGAAREGCLNGIRSIAMSIEKKNNTINWGGFKFYAPLLVKIICKNQLTKIFLI